MQGEPRPTVESASRSRLWRASAAMLGFLLLAGLAVVGLFALPLTRSVELVLLGWLLVVLAGYWLYAGLGYRPFLLLQLLAFSTAASLGSAHLVFGLDLLRTAALAFAVLGGVLAVINLAAMLRAALTRGDRRPA